MNIKNPESISFRYRLADLPILVSGALSYAVVAKLFLWFSLIGGNVTLIFPPSGIALAYLLVYGLRAWPGVFLGALIVNLWVGDPFFLALMIATGSTLQAVVGTRLLTARNFRNTLDHLRHYIELVFWGGTFSTLIAAVVGVSGLALWGIIEWTAFPAVALKWWMGDMLGVILMTPALLVWKSKPDWLMHPRIWEAIAALALTLLYGQITFLDSYAEIFGQYPKDFWLAPFVFYIALRLGRHGIALALILITMQASMGAYEHVGYFADDLAQTGMLNVWFYCTIYSLIGMSLAVLNTEQKLTLARSQAAEKALHDQHAFMKAIFENEPECVKVITADGKLLEMNPAGLSILGVKDLEQAQQLGLLSFVDPEFRDKFRALHRKVCAGENGMLEFPITSLQGNVRWLESHAAPLRNADGTVTAMLAITRDITEHRAILNELEQQAQLDFLTGLYNRRHFIQQAEQELSRAKRYQNALSILMLDIDHFKQVNDLHGHQIGDLALQKLSQVLADTLRKPDFCGRMGGEEFAILLPETGQHEAREVAERIRLAVEGAEIPLEQHPPLRFTVSLGVATLGPASNTLDALLSDADNALYVAKKSGRNKVCTAPL